MSLAVSYILLLKKLRAKTSILTVLGLGFDIARIGFQILQVWGLVCLLGQSLILCALKARLEFYQHRIHQRSCLREGNLVDLSITEDLKLMLVYAKFGLKVFDKNNLQQPLEQNLGILIYEKYSRTCGTCPSNDELAWFVRILFLEC